MKIGKNIKAIRLSQNMEQKDLAEKLHISNKTISSWECDRTEPNIGMFEKIAEALNVTKTELLDGKKNDSGIIVKDFGLSSGNDVLDPAFDTSQHRLTNEEMELLALYRLGQYKELINKIIDKI